ncbi:tubulin polyglutamylase complex subunit 1 [Mytilus galloprovincialis]|uniref:Tubulin polyglutamylase complex subunit 1 n=1 Tax=Mytilus galloprovincialis TaxID=29158 RepID=A0A8B6DZ02_MYTGA|nr:tubulin polyglutamylase complex subunit 1 [Mytilus galloprovincialis]
MADKRKPNSADDRPQESDRQFLERSNVGSCMKDVLGKIIANRPEDPIAFMADYFDSLEEQTSLVARARQLIIMTHHSRPVFDINVRMAYETLQKSKCSKKLHGVNGTVYNELIRALCRDFPTLVINRLLRRIECLDFEAVTYDVFKSGVFTCCVLEDYLRLVEYLFNSLDFTKTGKCDKAVCDAVLEQLKTSLASNKTDARKIVESGYNLGPDGLFHVLDKAMKRDTHVSTAFTLEMFTAECCEAFIAKVKDARDQRSAIKVKKLR